VLEGAINVCDANAAFLWFYGQTDIKMKFRETFLDYLKDEYEGEEEYEKVILSLTNEIRKISEEVVEGDQPTVVRDLYQGEQTEAFLESLVSTTMKIHGKTRNMVLVVIRALCLTFAGITICPLSDIVAIALSVILGSLATLTRRVRGS